eukprot:scaffold2957_cov232-Chaetoceros_neogracile.AAC.13
MRHCPAPGGPANSHHFTFPPSPSALKLNLLDASDLNLFLDEPPPYFIPPPLPPLLDPIT